MDYRLIEAADSPSFQDAVRAAIAAGWVPSGGVCVVSRTYRDNVGIEQVGLLYVQSMTRITS